MRFLILVASCAAGCGREDEEIKTYVVAPPTPRAGVQPQASPPERPVAEPADRGEPTDRMIGAIVPGRDRAWFFKAVGPKEAMAAAAPSIRGFLATVKIDDTRPVWSKPDAWKEEAGSSMRLATLRIPAGDDELEMSVIGLPLVGDWETQVIDNVNRWRGQLGLEKLAEYSEATESLGGAVEGACLVDASGWFEGGSMAPMAGRAPFANAPPPSRPEPPAPPSSNQLQETPPSGWSAEPGSSIRLASYRTPAGSVVTAFAFPTSAPQMADPLANVNRWRGELGLDPTTGEQLLKETETIPLMGEDGAYFKLVGKQETTLAAMLQRGDRVWFFKLRGPSDAAEADREAFREWLTSVSVGDR